ncbi:Detected protein of unknown function [Hibiscus syriacus]|uniref:Uncharacterized protein n=1 Tax=Hibiscus syriacus TaxID=106335 RepID=A0A6A3BQ62_HIBSY|nr:uncharacterized protein LOC120213571 [Hibiscus syriacus]KAE8717528.1 Detected protein of unknown function [Hibiscus syriacus]
MAFYADEEKVWKCAKHPSKRHRSGICPVCLQNKLASLCPDCAHTRPCACTATSSSSSSSFSSFSCFSTAGDVSDFGAVFRVPSLIGTEPAFRRSRSLGISFLRLKPENLTEKNDLSASKTPSFWSMFRGSTNTSKRFDSGVHRREVEKESVTTAVDERMMMRKSRSMAMEMTSHSGTGDSKSSTSTKGKGWYLTSPMKVLRRSRVSKFVFRQH